MGGGGSVQKQPGSITAWLEEQSEVYRKYAKLFIKGGYETVAFLRDNGDRAEIAALLAHKGVKRPHARGILKAYDELLAPSTDTGTATSYSNNTDQAAESTAIATEAAPDKDWPNPASSDNHKDERVLPPSRE